MAAAGLSIFCGAGRLPARQTAVSIRGGGGSGNGTVRKTNDGPNGTSERKTDEAVGRSSSSRFRMLSTTIRLQTATWEPTAVDEANGTKIESGTIDAWKATAATRNGTATWTPLEATALKYDELVMRLVWIFSMTVVAIAMVFVIMIVVFFKCYWASKPENANTPAAQNPWPQPNTDKVRGTTVNCVVQQCYDTPL